MTPVQKKATKAQIVAIANRFEKTMLDKSLAAQVDELGALEAELAPLKPKLARAEALRKALRERFEGVAPEKACEARGARFIAALGPKAIERTVDVAKLVKLIGFKAVVPLAKIALNALTRLTGPPQVAAGIASTVSAATGPRPLKIFELGRQEPRSGDQRKAA